MSEKIITVGSDFSGVGAFNQALKKIGVKYKEVFACDMDKYARQTFVLNYGMPEYFPTDVYEREIPSESLDIFMTSPPCQAFSLAGKRLGKEDVRGILFFNSLEFIQKNKPRFFIFENVKGLLSHDKTNKDADYGNTFKEWISLLGGKSVNGVYNFFPYDDAVPYHIYFQVLNAKHYGIPQNRERIFIVGIRDDEDNDFQFPRPFPLEKRLKDILESEVDEKYFLSEKSIQGLLNHKERHTDNGNGFGVSFKNEDEISNTVFSRYYKDGKENLIQIGTWRTHEDGKGFRETEDNNCPTIPARAREDGSGQPVVKIEFNYGRNSLNEVLENQKLPENVAVIDSYNKKIHTETSPSILATISSANNHHVFIPSNTKKGFEKAEEEEDSINFSNPNSKTRRGRVGKKVAQTLDTQCNQGVFTQFRIRRLTPRECFRLMDFPEDFVWDVSDSQAYKQAGNSICVGVLAAIISKLKL